MLRFYFATFGDIFRIHLEDEEPIQAGARLKGDNFTIDQLDWLVNLLIDLVTSWLVYCLTRWLVGLLFVWLVF